MPLSSQTAHIIVLTGLSKFTSNLLKVGQMEAAKMWNRCRDAQQSAMKERTKWPDRDMLQKLTKGRFSLYSQSAQMVCHAFLANVKTTVELRKQGPATRTRKSGFIRCCGRLRRWLLMGTGSSCRWVEGESLFSCRGLNG
jgi:hypothetical protein